MSCPAPARSKLKTAKIVASLREMAQKAGPNAKLPTARQLSCDFQVSTSTINDALKELERQNILKSRQGSGIYVSPNIHQKSIALVFGDNIFDVTASPFYSLLLRQCKNRVLSHGESFSLFMDLPDLDRETELPVHSDIADAVQSGRIHGVLLASRSSESQEEWLRSQGLPTVALGFYPSSGEMVILDYDAMIDLGVEALVKQGCRRIGLISPFDTSKGRFPWKRDVVRFGAAMQKHGLVTKPDWIVKLGDGHAEYRSSKEFGTRAFRSLYADKSETPDGLLLLDDMVTLGVLAAAHEQKIAVGLDIKMATHANKGSTVLENNTDRLTLLEFEPTEIAQTMLELLERLMAGRHGPESNIWIKPRVREIRSAAALE